MLALPLQAPTATATAADAGSGLATCPRQPRAALVYLGSTIEYCIRGVYLSLVSGVLRLQTNSRILYYRNAARGARSRVQYGTEEETRCPTIIYRRFGCNVRLIYYVMFLLRIYHS